METVGDSTADESDLSVARQSCRLSTGCEAMVSSSAQSTYSNVQLTDISHTP